MNDYWDMLRFACIFMGGTLAIAILAREAHVWWSERHTRKSLKAIRQMEDRYYQEMKQDAVQFVEDFYKEMDKRS